MSLNIPKGIATVHKDNSAYHNYGKKTKAPDTPSTSQTADAGAEAMEVDPAPPAASQAADADTEAMEVDQTGPAAAVAPSPEVKATGYFLKINKITTDGVDYDSYKKEVPSTLRNYSVVGANGKFLDGSDNAKPQDYATEREWFVRGVFLQENALPAAKYRQTATDVHAEGDRITIFSLQPLDQDPWWQGMLDKKRPRFPAKIPGVAPFPDVWATVFRPTTGNTAIWGYQLVTATAVYQYTYAPIC